MAKKPQQNPADIAKAAGKLAELKTRILFLLGALIVFRVGTFIPVPGVDPVALKDFFDQLNLIGNIPISLGHWEMTGVDTDLRKMVK